MSVSKPRFCMANVISYGQTFLDLVMHSAAYIRQHLHVEYGDVNPSHAAYSARLVKLALKSRLRADTGALWKKAEQFLTIFNGDWRDWSTKGLLHVCSMHCRCGYTGGGLAEQAASIYVELVLSSKPPIPALSRWLRCGETAKWFTQGAQRVTDKVTVTAMNVTNKPTTNCAY